jgi:hypothetical protein
MTTLTYDKWNVEAEALPAESIKYLLVNGFTQSLTDASSMSRADKAALLRDAGHEADALAYEGPVRAPVISAPGKALIDNAIHVARTERYEAILAGTVGHRTIGPRLDPLTRSMRDIAEERVRAYCAGANAQHRVMAMPKGDVLKAAIDKFLIKFDESIRKEAQERLDRTKQLAGEFDPFAEPAQEPEPSADKVQEHAPVGEVEPTPESEAEPETHGKRKGKHRDADRAEHRTL